MTVKRTAFFISDRTGVTAEMLGYSLLTQFSDAHFSKITLPFIDSVEKARLVHERVQVATRQDGVRPIIFSTLINPETRAEVAKCDALVLDFFHVFIAPLEAELGMESNHTVGRFHGTGDPATYNRRIDAVNFALSHDDGATTKDFDFADIILTGVSRSGKTPTCLYLAMQYGIHAANYPLTPEDFDSMQLPAPIRAYRHKLYGLTINPERLQQIRQERRPNSHYASLINCQNEVQQAEALFRARQIRFLDSTTKSIEELASTILQEANLTRRMA